MDNGSSRRTRRRSLLSGLGALAAAGAAGCVESLSPGGDDGSDGGGDGDGDAGVSAASGGSVVEGASNVELPVSASQLDRGASKDAIPAIVDPIFSEDWSGFEAEVRSQFGSGETIEPRLEADDLVVGISREQEARAYPLRILNWHEIVNDELGGPLLITYCPLCRSAIVAERRAGGEETRFGVSGLLFRNALVMYDEATESRWSQILSQAIQGELTGERLEILPSALTTWGEWQESHPETVVLRPPPDSSTISRGSGTRDYRVNPYAGYGESGQIGIGGQFDDERLGPKVEVLGVAVDGTARAYTADAIGEAGLIEDTVGGLPIVVTTTPDGTPIAWSRRVDGETLSLSIADERHLAGGDSRWRRGTGIAVDGPYEGQRLTQANSVSALFWFAWLDFYPETELYEP